MDTGMVPELFYQDVLGSVLAPELSTKVWWVQG